EGRCAGFFRRTPGRARVCVCTQQSGRCAHCEERGENSKERCAQEKGRVIACRERTRSMMLEFKVTFTAGHFHGEEWPPAPARFFQAIVAATHYGAHGLINQQVRDKALRWLEQQPPPLIAASAVVHSCERMLNYVPNYDDKLG